MQPSSRQLVLADVENLAATPTPSEAEVVEIRRHLHQLIERSGVSTLEIVACSHMAAEAVRFGWPSGHHRWRSGPDGADLALLVGCDQFDWNAPRFTRLIIASGDGIFAELACRMASLGVEVVVVVGRGQLSKRLQLAVGNSVIYLPNSKQKVVASDAIAA